MNFNGFYNDNYSCIYRFCLQWTGNSDDAKDIAQEVFTELFERLTKQADFINPRAWIYRVAYNRCINLHKRKQRLMYGDLLIAQVDVDDSLERREQFLRVRKAMDKLSEKERALVILYKEGFSYKEMSAVIEINENSVGKTLSRAIDKMTKLLV
ncbi:MAG TPA: RNA polymerase sigma factor [Tenuifilaceae bacterium]|nr:RNA polymerase sigma factor [Tenuifilaceae bacterium]HPI43903.1 RNA polymerase sigma factor [Tenuifilaceae bacterium]HPN21977.1 RNA polymerase sigma factor [Tenuifilaceae bacterium]